MTTIEKILVAILLGFAIINSVAIVGSIVFVLF